MKRLNRSLDYAKKINEYLLNLEAVKEYQKFEKILHQDSKIAKLEKEIKIYQKKIVNQKANQDDNVVKTIEEYQKIKNDFENHPIVVNYLYLKKEVDEILQSISSYINGQLLK
ncbi:MAG: YlbF family regulator [[Clostridium] spiroforme]|uniref:YlbF family regulator n=1 Tax=Thomasclavelia spiroformis TaxID=29348 RepID=A0A943EKH4_9FIRM|nr:YlbF family regulator [Thomasclavelia spiroformis]MBS5588357.1 YlbF family regulator [Thomasclavelia spiroformis]